MQSFHGFLNVKISLYKIFPHGFPFGSVYKGIVKIPVVVVGQEKGKAVVTAIFHAACKHRVVWHLAPVLFSLGEAEIIGYFYKICYLVRGPPLFIV